MALSRPRRSSACATPSTIAARTRAGCSPRTGSALGVTRLAVIDVDGAATSRSRARTAPSSWCATARSTTTGSLRAELDRRGHHFSTDVRRRGDRPPVRGARRRLRRAPAGDVRVRPLGPAQAPAAPRARPGGQEAPLLRAPRRRACGSPPSPAPSSPPARSRVEVDHRAIDLFLHYQCVPAPRSAFAGAAQAAAGAHARVERRSDLDSPLLEAVVPGPLGAGRRRASCAS